MKFTVSQSALAVSLSVVSKGIAKNTVNPILSGILMTSKEGILELQATDLTVSIRSKLAADVEEEGCTVISGRILQNIVKALPDAAITFNTITQDNFQIVSISCERSSFRLNTLNPAEFPVFPELELTRSIELPSTTLAQMVSKVYRVTSKDSSRPVLQGIQLIFEDTTIRLVATDSYRLAVCDTRLTTETSTEASTEASAEASAEASSEPFSCIVPGNTFHEVLGLPSMTETVLIGTTDSQIVFSFGTTTFISRRIEGTYPNFHQLIPGSCSTTVRVSTDVFAAALKRVSIIATVNPSVRLEVDPDTSTLTLSASTPDQGDSLEQIGIECEGDPVTIGLNHRFLSDCMNAIAQTDTLIIEFSGSKRPAIFRCDSQISYLYLLMPIRL